MSESRIEDIASYKKIRENISGFRVLKYVFSSVRPVLHFFGVNTKTFGDIFEKFDDLEIQVKELTLLPEKFNDLFVSKGWIIFELLNIEIIKEAVIKGENGDFEEAENVLVEHYTLENIQFYLRTMQGISAFGDRSRLAHLAAVDYAEGRYHACIPVVLALMDGLVNELNEENRSLFAEGTELKAWDSVSAHDRGWGRLVRVFSKTRQKTYKEQISIPYRNGIMHGMDLGYDNKIVAAKTWAGLFALREWAFKAERNQLKEPPEEPKLGWRETLKQIAKIEDSKKLIESWVPREITVGFHIPENGEPEKFLVGTPERRLVEFLYLWKQRNYGYMARFLPGSEHSVSTATPQQVRNHFADRCLTNYRIMSIKDNAPAVCTIEVELFCESDHTVTIKEFRMIYQNPQGRAIVSSQSGGQWVVYNAFYY